MTLGEQLKERERQWQLYHLEPEPLMPERDAQAVLADLSFLLQYISPDELLRDPDPEKHGIAIMRTAFAALSTK